MQIKMSNTDYGYSKSVLIFGICAVVNEYLV